MSIVRVFLDPLALTSDSLGWIAIT